MYSAGSTGGMPDLYNIVPLEQIRMALPFLYDWQSENRATIAASGGIPSGAFEWHLLGHMLD